MRLLVAYSLSSSFVNTTYEYLAAIRQYSGFDVEFVNVTHVEALDLDLSRYDAVFNNYCARYAFPGYVDARFVEKLKAFAGVKILAIQDEYDHTDLVKAAIGECGFDLVLTCVPQSSLDYVYPRAKFPGVEFMTVFTGYVPDGFAEAVPPHKALAERPILIGYRGRDIGGRYGRLGFDKYEIGRRMKEICVERGIDVDIAVDEESRIYGPEWMEFIGNCRSMLGSESGSNVFDFDGSIAQRYQEMTQAKGGVRPSYQDFLPVVEKRDAEIEMGQISPRVFECAVMRTPMILFRGRYSDVLRPDEHYIMLEKDFSNVDDVFARLKDLPALEAMAERAYAHLVGSDEFGYKAFLARVREAADRAFARKNWRPVAATPLPEAPADFYRRFNEDRPTLSPDRGGLFHARIDARTARILELECERLDASVKDHAATYLPLLAEGLDVSDEAQRRRLAPVVDAYRALVKTASDDRTSYCERHAEAYAAFERSAALDEPAPLREAAAAWLAVEQSSYAIYGNLFRDLNGLAIGFLMEREAARLDKVFSRAATAQVAAVTASWEALTSGVQQKARPLVDEFSSWLKDESAKRGEDRTARAALLDLLVAACVASDRDEIGLRAAALQEMGQGHRAALSAAIGETRMRGSEATAQLQEMQPTIQRILSRVKRNVRHVAGAAAIAGLCFAWRATRKVARIGVNAFPVLRPAAKRAGLLARRLRMR